MHSFDEISSPELELGLEDDVFLTDMTMTSSQSTQPQTRGLHQYPVPKWMRPTSSSSSPTVSYLRDRVYPFITRYASSLSHRLGPVLRPRLTARYILLTSLAIYTLYRLLTSQPLLASRLPAYTGPYGVGAVDIELPLDQPQWMSDVTFLRDGKPAFEVETVLFTLYYPTAKNSKQGRGGRREKLYWIPSPVSATAKGYARFLGMDNFLVRGLLTAGLWLVSPWGIPIPAQVGAPVLAAPGSDDGKEEAQDQLLPVMIFTHGMLSSRTDYTSYLGELASRGVVVAALEHRDGSSPGSAIRKKGGEPDTWRYWFGLKDLDTSASTTNTKEGGGGEEFDTVALKEAQLSFREAEISAAVTVLRNLHAGDSDMIASQNPRQPSSTTNFLSGFHNRLNTTHLLLGGHSYGATGALRALRPSPNPSPFTGGIILDPGKSSGPLNANVSVPLLIVHSSSWSKKHSVLFGRPHFDVVREIAEGVNDRCAAAVNDTKERLTEGQNPPCRENAKAWFLTSLGTSHPSITDAPLLEPFLLSWTTGSTMDAQDGVRQYVDLTRDFVRYQHTNTRHGLLALSETSTDGGVVVKEYDPKHNERMPEEYRKYWQIHVTPD